MLGSDFECFESSDLGVVKEPLGPGVLAAKGERAAGVEAGFGVSTIGFLTSDVLHILEIVVPSGNTGEEIFPWSGNTGSLIFAWSGNTGAEILGVDLGVYGGMYFFFPGNSGSGATTTSVGLTGSSPVQGKLEIRHFKRTKFK